MFRLSEGIPVPDDRLMIAEDSPILEPGLTAPESVVRRCWPTWVAPYRPPEGVCDDPTVFVAVRVNHGRAIVDCPFCPGAQIASPSDRRFFCVDCLHRNTPAEGRWVRVNWPNEDFVGHLTELLVARPPENRNWRVGETLDDLIAENAEHGLPVPAQIADDAGVN